MKNKNRVVFFNVLSVVILRGISVFTAPLFSRMLGTDSYGVLSNYSTWVSIIAIVFTLSVSATISNARVVYSEEEWDSYQSSVLGLACLIFGAFSLIVLLFLEQVANLMQMDECVVILMLVHSFGTSSLAFLTSRFGYEFRAGWNFTISIATAILTIVGSLVLIPQFPYERGYMGRMITLAVVYGVFGIAACVYIFYKGKKFIDFKFWKFCIPLAIPYVIHRLSDLLLGHSDILMLKRLGTDAMVGIYSLAYNFSAILYTVWTSLNDVWGVFFFEFLRKKQEKQLKETTHNYLELFTIIACGFLLLQPELYRIFASEDFWDGASLIPMFTVSFYAVFLSSACVNYESFKQKTRLMATGTVLACFSNLLLNYFWIPIWGMQGAALATMCSHLAQALYHNIVVRRIDGQNTFPITIKMILPYLTAFGAVLLLVGLTPSCWWLRWSIGAMLGIWELYKIIKRKSII